MKRTGLLVVVILTVFGVGTASAATVAFNPAFSAGKLGEGSTFTAAFTFTGTEYHGKVAPLTKATVHLPAGVGLTQSGFSTCEAATLEMSGVAGCPPGSIAGPVGSISFEAELGITPITESGTIQAVFSSSGLLFYVVTNPMEPVVIELVFRGTFVEDTSPYGQALTVELPLIEVIPGRPDASITAMTFSLGTSRKEGNTEVHSVTIPEACPLSGKFPWAANTSFHEGTPSEVTAETACPAPSGKTGTTTMLQVSNGTPAVGEIVTYTATAAPKKAGAFEPSGSVEFLDGGTPIGTCSAQPLTEGVSSSTATCQLSYPATGAHSITATYGGDTNFFGSASTAQTVTVNAEKETEEAARKQHEEEAAAVAAKKHQEEEAAAAAKKKQEEAAAAAAAAKKHQEEEAAAKKKQEEEKSKTKPPTRAQLLAKALKSCKKQPKKKRAKCEAKAKKKYASKAKGKKGNKK